jgi:Predicted signal-transduction protein containing cAMP-binding and CBS domains
MKVTDILNKKGSHIYSVEPGTSVYDALKFMGEKNIGALLVMEGSKLNGIISERDYARKVVLKGKTSLETKVSDIMTEKVITILPEDNLERCMELMSENHIRHIPVVKSGEVKGVISISDVVTAIIESQKETITYLQNYIVQ